MACLDEITDRMDIIIDMIGLKKDCCDDNVTYGPQPEITTEIEPEVGDPPDYYGETAVTDWDDWYEHVCYNAHIYVDMLVHQAEQMDAATVTAAWTIGLIAAGLAALSFVGLGLAVVYGLAALTAGGLIAAVTEGVFTNTASSIETSRVDIVCSLLLGNDLAGAVEDALSSGLDWDLFFQFADYGSATALIYEGGYNGDYLPADTKDDCEECVIPPLTDEDVYIWHNFGDEPTYDAPSKTWTGGSSMRPAGCIVLQYYFMEDAEWTTKLPVRIHVLTCDDDTTCGGAPHHRGLLTGSGVIFSMNHPNLPDQDDGVIDELYFVHGNDVEITFKLYPE